MKNKILSIVFLFLFFTTFAVINKQLSYVSADAENPSADGFTNVESVEIPLSDKLVLKDGTQVQQVFNSTDDMINLLVKVAFVAAGAVLFFMIIGAGFALIQGDSKDKDKAKSTMTSAAIGFVIMFSAYWIMQIIQMITGLNMGFQ